MSTPLKVCRRVCLAVVLAVGGTLASPAGLPGLADARAQAQTVGSSAAPILRALSSTSGKTVVCPEEPAPGNLLDPQIAGMESVDGWPDPQNAGLAPASDRASDGAGSMELTALAGGPMVIGTPAGREGVGVVPGYTYVASAQFGANNKPRPVSVSIAWYGPDGAALDVASGATVLQAAEGWTLASHSAVAPKGAAFAAVVLSVAKAFGGEKHYVDAASLAASLEDAPECQPDDDGGPGDGEPGPGDGDGEGGNGGNGDGGNGDGGNGDGGDGNGGDGNGGDGNHGDGNGTGNGNDGEPNHPAGDHPAPGPEEGDDGDAPGGHGTGGSESPDEGHETGQDGSDPAPFTPAEGWNPDGTYSTGSLMTAALKLKALGWTEQAISRKVFAPFLLGGEAGWTDTWGAPRSGGRTHEGQDVFCNYGDPVLATENGTVEFDEGGLGGRVARLHRPDGSYWYYAHLSDWNTEGFTSGDTVATGDVIGFCGNTGNAISTPPHVHFGLYTADGTAVNPIGHLIGWLQSAQKRTLGYVEKITRLRVLEVERLTSARRFGDGFTPTPSDDSGAPNDILLASRSLRMFSALQAALSQSGADLEATDAAGDLLDPELLHFELWLTSNELAALGPAVPAVPDVVR